MPEVGLQPVYAAGDCEIDLSRRELRVSGAPVPIGGRAFDIIEILIEAAGELVTKDALMDRVWRGAIVGDNVLQVHVSALRKALGAHRAMLRTESGRGYRLLGHWTARLNGSEPPAIVPVAPIRRAEGSPATNVPVAATPLIGRYAAARNLRDLISAYRVVTLTGPGGIGKTTLAIEAARGILDDFAGGGWLVELASLADPSLVPSTVIGVLGLKLMGGTISAEAVARGIGDANLLLILDNCEHVIDAAAELAEAVARFCPRTSVLATSREVLRIDGEHVYRVPPLDVPEVGEEDPQQVLSRGAVELLVARTTALDSDFSPATRDIPAIAAICRQLDGIPLAIEFAAARAATLGLRQVAAGLGDRFRLLSSGRRTALPRHQTLRAALDWSYELLPPDERRLLRHLAIFPGGFTFEAAEAVGAPEGAGAFIVDGISSLVAKSLLAVEEGASLPRWRLLETTRAYALEKLHESGEAAETERRHAEFYRALFSPFASEGRLQAGIDDLGRYRRELDNLRAALTWTFSAAGDATLGVELAAAAAHFWSAMSLLAESCEWAGRALQQIGTAVGTRHEMVLQCTLGLALIYTQGMTPAARAASARALALAQRLKDVEHQQRAIHDLWLFSARAAASNEALALAHQYEALSAGRELQSQAQADLMVGISLTYLAKHSDACERLQRAIGQSPIGQPGSDLNRFGIGVRVSAASHLTVNLLSRGSLEAASRTATSAIEEARVANDAVRLCIALSWAAGFTFLSLGNLETAERYGEELVDHAHKHALRPFHATGLCVRGSLAAKRGDPESGLDPLRGGLAAMQETSYLLFHPFFSAELAVALGAMDRVDDGLAEIDGAMRMAEETDYRWFVPEILRVKGELLLQQAPGNEARAEGCFRVAAERAGSQGGLFWELRAALSAARLRVRQNDRAGAARVLRPVYDRFTEGFGATDLREAKALLDGLR